MLGFWLLSSGSAWTNRDDGIGMWRFRVLGRLRIEIGERSDFLDAFWSIFVFGDLYGMGTFDEDKNSTVRT